MTDYEIQRLKAAAFDALTHVQVEENEMLALLCGMALLIQRLEQESEAEA